MTPLTLTATHFLLSTYEINGICSDDLDTICLLLDRGYIRKTSADEWKCTAEGAEYISPIFDSWDYETRTYAFER